MQHENPTGENPPTRDALSYLDNIRTDSVLWGNLHQNCCSGMRDLRVRFHLWWKGWDSSVVREKTKETHGVRFYKFFFFISFLANSLSISHSMFFVVSKSKGKLIWNEFGIKNIWCLARVRMGKGPWYITIFFVGNSLGFVSLCTNGVQLFFKPKTFFFQFLETSTLLLFLSHMCCFFNATLEKAFRVFRSPQKHFRAMVSLTFSPL